jgi:predicted nucleic acid-binding protein
MQWTRTAPTIGAAASWLEEVLAGDSRVGLPWQTIGAFLRIATHPRVAENPLSGPDALVPDAQLAALAVEHGVELVSADTDFMRFPGLRWVNPLSP